MKIIFKILIIFTLLFFSNSVLAADTNCVRTTPGITSKTTVGKTYTDVWTCTSTVPANVYSTLTMTRGASDGFSFNTEASSCQVQTNPVPENGKCTVSVNFTPAKAGSYQYAFQVNIAFRKGGPSTAYTPYGPVSTTTSGTPPPPAKIAWTSFSGKASVSGDNDSCNTDGASASCAFAGAATVSNAPDKTVDYFITSPTGTATRIDSSSWTNQQSGLSAIRYFSLQNVPAGTALTFKACIDGDDSVCTKMQTLVVTSSVKPSITWSNFQAEATAKNGDCLSAGCYVAAGAVLNNMKGNINYSVKIVSGPGTITQNSSPSWSNQPSNSDAKLTFNLSKVTSSTMLEFDACAANDSSLCASHRIPVQDSDSKLTINWPGKTSPSNQATWSNKQITGKIYADACVVTTSTDYNIKTRNCDPDYNVQYNVFLTSNPSVSTTASASGAFSLPQEKYISDETVTVKVQATKDGKVDPSITPVTTTIPVSGSATSGMHWPGQYSLAASAEGSTPPNNSIFNTSYVADAYFVDKSGKKIVDDITYTCTANNVSKGLSECNKTGSDSKVQAFSITGDFTSGQPSLTVVACYQSHCLGNTISLTQGAGTNASLVWPSYGEPSTAVVDASSGDIAVNFKADACVELSGRSDCTSSYVPKYLVSANPIQPPPDGVNNTYCVKGNGYAGTYPGTTSCAGGACVCSTKNGCMTDASTPSQIYVKAILCPAAYSGAQGLAPLTADADPIAISKSNGQCVLHWQGSKHVRAIYNANGKGQITQSIYYPKDAVVTPVKEGDECSGTIVYSAMIGSKPFNDIGPSFYNDAVGSFIINSDVITTPTSAAVVTATYGEGDNAISINSTPAAVARVNDPADPNADGTTPTKSLRIFNNSPYTIYPVIEAAMQPAGQDDWWLVGEFAKSSSQPHKEGKFQSNQLYRIYVNGDKGLPSGKSIVINLPLYTHVCNGDPTQSAGCQNNPGFNYNYVDWWRGGRVYIYASLTGNQDAQNAIKLAMKADQATPTTYVDAAPVQCDMSDATTKSVCDPTSMTIYKGAGPSGGADLPDNYPQQLVEYTLGGVYVDGCTQGNCLIDLSAVDYDISYVDNAYLPIGLANHVEDQKKSGYQPVGYIGSLKSFDTFSGVIGNFISATPWPQYQFSAKPYNRVPGGYNVWQNLGAALTDPQAARDKIAALWANYNIPGFPSNPSESNLQNAVNTTPQDCSSMTGVQQKVCRVWNFLLLNFQSGLTQSAKTCPGGTFIGASNSNKNAPSYGSMLSYIYGWVPFNGCITSAKIGTTFTNDLINTCYSSPNNVRAICSTTGSACVVNPDPKVNTCFVKPDYAYSNVSSDFKDLMYLYKTDPNAVFNPYVKLIHDDLDMSAYAFSIDDAVGNMNEQGDGLTISVGKTDPSTFGPGGYAFSKGMRIGITFPATISSMTPVYYAEQSGNNPGPIKNYALITKRGVFIDNYSDYPKTLSLFDASKKLIGSFKINCPPVKDPSPNHSVSNSAYWWSRNYQVMPAGGAITVIHPTYCNDPNHTPIVTNADGTPIAGNVIQPNIQAVRDATATGTGGDQKVTCASDDPSTTCNSTGASYISLPGTTWSSSASASLSWFGKLKNWIAHLI